VITGSQHNYVFGVFGSYAGNTYGGTVDEKMQALLDTVKSGAVILSGTRTFYCMRPYTLD